MEKFKIFISLTDILYEMFKSSFWFIIGYLLYLLGFINNIFWGSKNYIFINESKYPNILRTDWFRYSLLSKSNKNIKERYVFMTFIFILLYFVL
jgi:hypothetical protein